MNDDTRPSAESGDDNEHEVDWESVDDDAADIVDDDVLADTLNTPPGLTAEVRALQDHVSYLTERLDRLEAEEDRRRHEPAPWVLYTPPAADGQPPHEDEDPGFTIGNFVAWYNLTYAGLPGTRSRRIPDCWPHHPGLASEIATLAYAWHDAFTGRTAHPHKAQLWHHHDRPGFADRLSQEWTHPHCHDGSHKSAGAHSRPDRYGLTSHVEPPVDAQ